MVRGVVIIPAARVGSKKRGVMFVNVFFQRVKLMIFFEVWLVGLYFLFLCYGKRRFDDFVFVGTAALCVPA